LDLLKQNVKTLWGSFEIKNQRLGLAMMRQFTGGEVTEANFHEVSEQFSQLPLWFLRFHGSAPVDEVMSALEAAFYSHDIEHIILDNLQFMLGSALNAGASKFDIQDEVISRLRSFATRNNCHITLCVHPRKEPDGSLLGLSSVFGSGKVTQEADNVILLQSSDPDRMFRSINLRKNRFEGTLGNIPFRFDPKSKKLIEMTPNEFAIYEEKIRQQQIFA